MEGGPMCRSGVLAALVGLMACPAPGAAPDEIDPTLHDEEQRVLAVEDEWIDAEVNRDDTTLHRIIDDRFVLNSSDGTTSGKADLIRRVLESHMVSQKVSERTVLVDGVTAITFGTTELRFAAPGKDETATLLRYTAVYVKRENQWRALALQMTKRTG